MKPLLFFALLFVGSISPLSSLPSDCSISPPPRLSPPPPPPKAPSCPSPWFTGPIIAPPGLVYSEGHYQVQNYVFVNIIEGLFSNHWKVHSIPTLTQVNPQIFATIGLTSWMDILFIPQFFISTCQNSTSVEVGDLPIGFDFQVIGNDFSPYFPAVKFTLKETIPIGRYDHLNKNKNGTDISGIGSFQTNASLLFYKVYELAKCHFLSTYLNFNYSYLAPLKASDLSIYAPKTVRVSPGAFFQGLFSFELSLTQNLAFAMDTLYTHTFPTKIHHGGTLPSQDSVNICPALEWNFSSNFGICMGAYLSLKGRNTPCFQSVSINFCVNQ